MGRSQQEKKKSYRKVLRHVKTYTKTQYCRYKYWQHRLIVKYGKPETRYELDKRIEMAKELVENEFFGREMKYKPPTKRAAGIQRLNYRIRKCAVCGYWATVPKFSIHFKVYHNSDKIKEAKVNEEPTQGRYYWEYCPKDLDYYGEVPYDSNCSSIIDAVATQMHLRVRIPKQFRLYGIELLKLAADGKVSFNIPEPGDWTTPNYLQMLEWQALSTHWLRQINQSTYKQFKTRMRLKYLLMDKKTAFFRSQKKSTKEVKEAFKPRISALVQTYLKLKARGALTRYKLVPARRSKPKNSNRQEILNNN